MAVGESGELKPDQNPELPQPEAELVKYIRENRATYTRDAIDRRLIDAGLNRQMIAAAWISIDREPVILPEPPSPSSDYVQILKEYITAHRQAVPREHITERLVQAGYTVSQIESTWNNLQITNRSRVMGFLLLWGIFVFFGAYFTRIAVESSPGSGFLYTFPDSTRQSIFSTIYIITYLAVAIGTVWFGTRQKYWEQSRVKPVALLVILFFAWGAAVIGTCFSFAGTQKPINYSPNSYWIDHYVIPNCYFFELKYLTTKF